MPNELKRIKTNIYLFVLIAFFIGIDQISKYIIRQIGGFYICNKGIAWGIPIHIGVYLIIFSLILIIVINYKSKILNLKLISNFKSQIKNWPILLAFSVILIFSGAMSNIIDRLIFGCVIDFIDLKFWPIFNLADVYISFGAIILILHNLKRVTHNEKY